MIVTARKGMCLTGHTVIVCHLMSQGQLFLNPVQCAKSAMTAMTVKTVIGTSQSLSGRPWAVDAVDDSTQLCNFLFILHFL